MTLVGMFAAWAAMAQAEDCEQATDLVLQAYDGGQAGMAAAEQQQLLQQALQLCPQHPEAHNNLGDLLENAGDYDAALSHYRAAVQSQPDLAAAWFGIGEVYGKTGQFPLALDAYLNGCHDPDARQRVEDLPRSERYKISEAGEILNKESLLLLFDETRREDIRFRLKECGFGFKASVATEFIFRNLLFDLGQATLQGDARPQIEQICAALREISGKRIIINDHTDKQWSKDAPPTEAANAQCNLELSQARAATVADALAELGVPRSQMETNGYGWTQPLVNAETGDAYAQNRRVTIEISQ